MTDLLAGRSDPDTQALDEIDSGAIFLLPEPPVGAVVGGVMRVGGRQGLTAELRRRWADGLDSVLVGPKGAGKRQLARDAAAHAARGTLEVSIAELRRLPDDEREASLAAMAQWLSRTGHGLLLVDTEGDAIVIRVPQETPAMITASMDPPGVVLEGRMAVQRVPVGAARPEDARLALEAWSEDPAHPAVSRAALDAAVHLAGRFVVPGTLPGAAVSLIRAAAHPARPLVDVEHVEQAVASATALPLALVSDGERGRLATLESRLSCRIVGQPEAISSVVRAIRRRSVRLGRLSRPQGAFLFVGPTGVGKTELARALACELFGSEQALVRFDCAEYQREHEVARMIGAPPGYVGHERPGRLISELQRGPNLVLLFDEIEKAHWAVHDFLLGALDSGVVHGAKGERATLWNSIVVMTSNLGSRAADHLRKPLGFGAEAPAGSARESAIRRLRASAIGNTFRPEFMNRLDAVVHFDPLGRDELDRILDIKLAALDADWLARYRISFELGPRMRDRIVDDAATSFGAGRSIERALERQLYDRLADALLDDGYEPGSTFQLELDGDEPRLVRTVTRVA